MIIKDADKPNLFVGKLIGNSKLEAKVLSFDDNNIEIQVTQLNDKYFERYLDVGGKYPLFRHQGWNGSLLLWEVDPDHMKRDVSQILLQWEENIGWTWDLDM